MGEPKTEGDRLRPLKTWTSRYLDGRWGRPLLGLLYSGYLTATREPCRVYHNGTDWVHRCRQGVWLSPHAGAILTYNQAIDIFLWAYMPKTGETIVDIGAGVGCESAPFSNLVGPAGRVVAVEAHPKTYELLVTNIASNALHNVDPRNVAIVSEAGPVTITDLAARYEANTVMGPSGTGIPIPGTTLDALYESLGIDDVGLLKVNIEGAEIEALDGATDALRKTRNVCVSCHDFEADRTGREFLRTKSAVEATLKKAGFGITSRPDDPRPYVRDYVYGTRTGRALP